MNISMPVNERENTMRASLMTLLVAAEKTTEVL